MEKKILYFECKTGAAGDMLMGALYELLSAEDQKVFLHKINSISEQVTITPEFQTERGIGGVHMKVEVAGKEEDEHHRHEHHDHEHHDHEHHGHKHHDHEHHDHEHHGHEHHAHTTYDMVLQQLQELDFCDAVKQHASQIYQLIGEAESKVHQTQINQIHFHEVGTLDALIDVAGCCLAIDLLAPDEIQCSPVCVGNGTIRCAHGILPVPAPATAEIIKGMPIYSSSFDGELLTPTGAAVLKHFVQKYKKEMEMEIEQIGYGLGTRQFEQISMVRVFLGHTYTI